MMSKAILILEEMPKECLDCELLNGYDNSCVGGKIGYDAIYEDRIKPKWCPLKPLPKKKEVDEHYKMTQWNNDCDFAYNCGYNTCLEDILGGKEE